MSAGAVAASAAATTTERDPLTERGRRTRENLLVEARSVFEAKGYPATRISDIAEAAGVAHGTVYTYFEDKADIFKAVVFDLTTQLEREWRISPQLSEPVDRIAEANRNFLDSYSSHARLLEVVEQVGTTELEYRQLLANFRQRYVERAVTGIRRLQTDGIVDRELDAYLAGSALCAMVEGFGRQWLVRRERHDPQVVSNTLTRLWANALGLDSPTTHS